MWRGASVYSARARRAWDFLRESEIEIVEERSITKKLIGDSNSQNLNKMPYKIASNIGNKNKSDRKCRLIE